MLTQYGLVKRAEHFWKGLSSNESQISAVPPDRYGDRFVKFITGITKTREAADLEKAEQQGDTRRQSEILSDPRSSGASARRSSQDPPGTSKVMEKAEKQAEKSKRQGADESNVPSKKLTSARSPSAERGDPGGYTLPVVEEDVEGQSTGGRSGRSGRSNEPSPQPHAASQRATPHDTLDLPARVDRLNLERDEPSDAPPPPPTKDARPITPNTNHRSSLPQIDGPNDSLQDSPPQGSMLQADKTLRKRASDLNKALPKPPADDEVETSDFTLRSPDAS